MEKKKEIAFIGTYTQKEDHVDGKGEGILIYETGPESVDWKLISSFPDIINPSFLCLSPTHDIIYAVSEQGPGVPDSGSVVKVIAYDKVDYNMTELQSISAQGDAPCYISVTRDGGHVMVANYLSGNVVIYKVNEDGTLMDGVSLEAEGSGRHPRQDGPHAHYIRQHPQNDDIYSVDLGRDMITQYAIENDSLKVTGFLGIRPGSGPRHLVWGANGKNLYTIDELRSSINFWSWEGRKKEPRQEVSLFPKKRTGPADAADIHITDDGRFIYATIRGSYNEIITLEVEPGTGNLTEKQRISAGGDIPRNFALSPGEDYIAVALQNSDRIKLFPRNKETGLLSETAEVVNVMTPVCIVFKEQ